LQLRINGKATDVSANQTLLDLITLKNLNQSAIVVEHNRTIVPAPEWPTIVLQPDDAVEILTFVGGG